MLLPPGEGMTEEEGQVELHNASITYYILEPGKRSSVCEARSRHSRGRMIPA
jgi:hypothetical protein